MKRFTYILITLGIFLSMCASVSAQVPGYQGKRFILKIDPFSPLYQKGIIANFDYVVARKIVFSVSYNQSERHYTQRLSAYKQAFGVFPEEKGGIEDKQVGIEIKFFPDKSIPAPKGIYAFSSYYQGFAIATGNTYNPRDNGRLESYQIDNLRSSTITVGIGNQSIVKDKMVVEFDFGIAAGNFQIPDSTPEDAAMSFQTFTDKYGPNVYSFGELFDNGGVGFSFHLKVGYLLF